MSELMTKVEKEIARCKDNYFWMESFPDKFRLQLPYMTSEAWFLSVIVSPMDQDTIIMSTVRTYSREIKAIRERLGDGFLRAFGKRILGQNGYVAESGQICFICSLDQLWVALGMFFDGCKTFDGLCKLFGQEEEGAGEEDMEALVEEKGGEQARPLEKGDGACAT